MDDELTHPSVPGATRNLEFSFLQPTAETRSSPPRLPGPVRGEPAARKREATASWRADRALRTLSATNHAIIRATVEDRLLRDVCELLVEFSGYRMAWAGIAQDDEARTVRPAAQAGFETGYLESACISWADTELGRGPTGTAIRERRPIVARDIQTDPRFACWRDAALRRGYASSVALPLLLDANRCLGALNVYAAEPDAFDAAEVEFLAALANDLAYGIRVLRDRRMRDMAEQLLRGTAEHLSLAPHAANQGLYDLNVQTGEAQVSAEYAAMLGYDPAEFRETNAAWLDRMHPGDREPVAARHRDYIAGRLPEYRVEFRQRTKAGEWKWILSLGQIVERDTAGRPLRMLGTHTDITERKQAEEALRESQEKYQRLIETTDTGYVIIGEHGQVTDANGEYVRLTGRDRLDEVLGHSVLEWTAAHDHERNAAEVRRCVERGLVRNLELDYVTPTGRITPVEIDATVVGRSESLQILCLCRDISERKRAEEEREKLQAQLLHAQKMESVARLAGGVAHDFNNMLQAILGNASLGAEQLPPNHPSRECLEEIQKSAQRSAELTRQLLAFARKQTITPRVLELNDTVAEMLKMLRPLIGEDIDLVWMPGPDLWPVKMDPSQVDQILANLCVNARDAIAGAGRVTIATENVMLDAAYASTQPECVPGPYVLLEVCDTGSGIDAAARAHLFEPFFTTKELGKGTGLGLATVFGIVKQNQGLINVDSEPGKGTTFRLYLPAARGAKVEAAPQTLKPSPRGTETVLLVEDEEQILTLGRRILELQGYSVLTASTAEAALTVAAGHAGPIHLLVTDVVMPGMNGKQLRDRLQTSLPDLKCLFVSGYTADVIAQHGVLDEGTCFLQKPFNIHSLAERVRQVLECPGPGNLTPPSRHGFPGAGQTAP